MIAALRLERNGLRLQRALWRPDPAIIRRILHIGLPAAADAGLMWLAHMAFIKAVVASGQGEVATAHAWLDHYDAWA